MIIIARDRVKKSIAKGMTLEEIKALNVTKEYDEKWVSGFINLGNFVKTLYSDLIRDDENNAK
jgi:hypothetical protein